MGTHPIFESDFDCLTEGMKTLWTAIFTIISQLFLVSGFIAIAQGPKYVLLYGVLLSAVIGLIRQFSSLEAVGTSIIKLCATKEQQERCLSVKTSNLSAGSVPIDSNSKKNQ